MNLHWFAKLVEVLKSPEPYHWRELYAPANVPNWILAAIAGWAGIMALKTLRAINRQAEVMKLQLDTSISQERPRLSVEITGFNLGNIPTVEYELMCHGTTPAFISSSWQSVTAVPIPDYGWPRDAFGFPMGGLPSVLTTGTIKRAEFIMFSPGYEQRDEAILLKNLEHAELYLHFRLRIVFTDIFDPKVEHEFIFRRIYGTDQRPSPIYAIRYPGWNASEYSYGQEYRP
jgi:hypothetical protein